MPELPEVETLKRELAQAVVGKKLSGGKIWWAKAIKPLTPAAFLQKLRGKKILAVDRRAKILIFKLSGGQFLLIHLKLTGQLIFKPKQGKTIIGGHPTDPTKYTRAIFYFTDGSRLFFNDLRKFGWLKLITGNELKKLKRQNGIEPLSRKFTFEEFDAALTRYPNRKVKQTLLDQALIAGLGNIYSDESCFRAGILPTRKNGGLKRAEKKKLYQAIKLILRLAIKHKGTSANTYVQLDGAPGGFVPYLKVYGRAGQPCRRCHAPVKKIKLNGRGTHYCPECQR